MPHLDVRIPDIHSDITVAIRKVLEGTLPPGNHADSLAFRGEYLALQGGVVFHEILLVFHHIGEQRAIHLDILLDTTDAQHVSHPVQVGLSHQGGRRDVAERDGTPFPFIFIANLALFIQSEGDPKQAGGPVLENETVVARSAEDGIAGARDELLGEGLIDVREDGIEVAATLTRMPKW